MLLFVAPRSEFTMLDDWGDLLGLKGSGSQSIVFDDGRIPAHWAIEDTLMVDFDVSGGTPGLRSARQPALRRPRARVLHDDARRR